MGEEFTSVFLFVIVSIVLAASMIVASALLAPSRSTKVKQMPYEAGMDPIGDARQRFDVRFYLVAIMFLVFDVELLFLYPWAVVAYREGGYPEPLPIPVFVCVLTFILLLFVAYVYGWKKGAFT